MEINEKFFYIKDISTVIQSQITRTSKQIKVDGRHSDAFVYILSGSCEYCFSEGFYLTVNEGDILYLSKSAVYRMLPNKNYEFIFCDFCFISEEYRKSNAFSVKEKSHAKRLFEKLRVTFESNESEKQSKCASILYEIYSLIINRNETYNNKSIHELMMASGDYINNNLSDQNLSVEFLARRAKMSEVYFRKKFKETFSVSPSEYIVYSRIEKAKELMKYPFITLSDCAQKSGFSSLQYFCRVFKKVTGISPDKFRKNK